MSAVQRKGPQGWRHTLVESRVLTLQRHWATLSTRPLILVMTWQDGQISDEVEQSAARAVAKLWTCSCRLTRITC